MMDRSGAEPREQTQTLRQSILDCLEEGPLTARELSALVHIREKDVAPHLEHLEKSLRRSGKRLVIEPAECLQCGFRFEKRRRFTRPSACPRCRCQRIDPPVFRLASQDDPASPGFR
jgi:predicted Zn-ribbon and HTH transcriptional regulator